MLSRFFINRPIFATVLSILIVVAGVITLRSLPVEQYPTITPPTVVVEAQYPGANATTIAQMVATPIEQQVNGVEGMLYMSSTSSSAGVYRLTVTFEVGTDLVMFTRFCTRTVAMSKSVPTSKVTGKHDPKFTSARSDKNRSYHHQRIHQRGHVSHVDLR